MNRARVRALRLAGLTSAGPFGAPLCLRRVGAGASGARWSSSSSGSGSGSGSEAVGSSSAPPPSSTPDCSTSPPTGRAWSTPLAKALADAIETTGPLSLATYMRQCLTSDLGGYYTSRGRDDAGTAVFGRGGDFVTSPEISQVFGELLGVWAVAEWMSQGMAQARQAGLDGGQQQQSQSRMRVQLVEVGPGKGTLMADMLRSFRNFRSFASSIDAVYLVEASPVLRDVQKQTLCGDAPMEEIDIGYKSTSAHLGVPVIWTEHLRFVPENTVAAPFIFAHEFFDALPIHAFQSVPPAPQPPPQTILTPTGPIPVRTGAGQTKSTPQWREFVVSANPDAPGAASGSRTTSGKPVEPVPEFRLSLAKAANPSSLVMPESSPRYQALKHMPGATIEICPEGQAYAQEFAWRIGGPFPSPPSSPSSSSPAAPPPPSRSPRGAALILDYGPATTIPANSLRGIRAHTRVSPLTAPGAVDLSADVDFVALAHAALDASPGVEAYGPVEQGAFLEVLGIEERVRQLVGKVGKAGKGAESGQGEEQHQREEAEEKRRGIESGWRRLVERGGGGMGRIYKALAIVPESGGKRRPVGFGGGLG